jgi:hypothetical protein
LLITQVARTGCRAYWHIAWTSINPCVPFARPSKARCAIHEVTSRR